MYSYDYSIVQACNGFLYIRHAECSLYSYVAENLRTVWLTVYMYVGMSVLSEFSRTYEGQVMEQSQANNDKNQSIYFVNLKACEDFRPSAKDHKFN